MLGGGAVPFAAPARDLLFNELDLIGSRYATKQEVIDSLDLVARGEIRPMVSKIASFEGLEALHDELEQGRVTGRAALRVQD